MLVQILAGVQNTLLITVLSLVYGAIIALPLAAARRSKWQPLRLIATVYADLVRAIPPITWLFLIYFGLPQYALRLDSMTAAIVGFTVISSGYMAEVYRSGLLAVPTGQWEAATALGMKFFARTRYVITPQAFKVTLSPIVAYGIGLLKDSAVASAIGVHDITYQASLAAKTSHQGLLAFVIAGLLYVAISVPLALATRRLDSALRMKLEVV